MKVFEVFIDQDLPDCITFDIIAYILLTKIGGLYEFFRKESISVGGANRIVDSTV